MSNDNKPTMPRSQTVYGEVIYWLAILAAIICMIGPVIAMYSVENNVLNPHYLFASIFDGKDAQTIWDEVGGGLIKREPALMSKHEKRQTGDCLGDGGDPEDCVLIYLATALEMEGAKATPPHELTIDQ